ncbi:MULTISPECIES: DUF6541 family protein [unclassified Gordonia (in: high G+C Gram-positive bacteria)]|uniref:DUF6541 family protein n=1 Tax=unclassified Gordonia (in: high G+C Gram-positive bacteria) TaxID=2657482 RepID=UPI00071C29B4|nr:MULTISPECIES: DUF6541 family protein [unclassified Gordonia (in: high G+C Gram-positive bacteria)]KSU58952.1 hypothetical protein AS181_09860 [Gordonia sp. SGD-V-85]SCC18404.1 hypothetical protein GA0061091_106285 [Gordonia sp. v-85]
MMLGAWVVVVTALVLILPGAFVGRRMNLPWPVALAAGPPITFALVSILTVLYSVVGFEWNAVSALVGLVFAVGGAWVYSALLLTRWGQRLAPVPDADGESRVGRTAVVRVAAGLGLGGLVIAVTCIRPIATTAFAGLGNISQVWDSLWHASSLRWIYETGVGSAMRMGELMNYDTQGFNYYPNTWHALGALLFPLTGADPVELYNTYSPAVLAITVPLGVASLAYWFARHRYDVDSSALIAGTAGALSALFPSLPYVEVQLTSVPNAVGVSLAPVAAVLVMSVVSDRSRVLPAALAVAGVTATHPSGLIVVGVIVGLWWLCEGLWRPVAGRLRDLATLAVTAVVTLVLIAPVVLGTIRVADTNELPFFDFREETIGVLDGLVKGAFNGTIPLELDHFPVWPLIVVTLLGLIALVWLRCWAGLVAWFVFALVTANAMVSLGPLSYPLGAIGGYFYNSPHRLTFVVAIISAAAAGVAIGVLALGVAGLVRRRVASDPADGLRKAEATSGKARWVVAATYVVLLGLIAGAAVVRYPPNAQIASKERGGKYVGPDDLAAYEWLAAQPDAQDVLVLNNLDQGTGWLYPVTGVTPMFPFYRANEFSERQRDLFWGVSEIGADPAIDQIVRDMNVHYVIDSPPSYWEFQRGMPDPARGHQGDPFLALRQNGAPGLTEVFRRGDAVVYRVNDLVYPPPPAP